MGANQAYKLLFIRSFLLCMAANNVIPTPTISKYCCSAGECTALNITKLHLYDQNRQALEDWTRLTRDCPSSSVIHSTSPAMSELVMMASSRCEGSEPRYYVQVLGDHKNNSNYRIDIAPGGPNNTGYYRSQDYKYCINTSTVIDRQNLRGGDFQGESFTVLVTNKITTTETQIEDSDADVFARVLVSQEGYGAIYTTYNTTNGIDYCSQKYIPLLADDIGSDIIQDANSTQLTVWWEEQDHSNGYIFVMGDNCTAHGSCSIVKNTTKVTVNFNDLSSILDKMKIRIYNVITTNCTNPEFGGELVHLFKGCTGKCCDNSMYYHNPTITPSTDPPTSTATVTHATTDCDKTENTSTTEHFQMPYSNVNEIRTNSSTSITPIITGHVTITRMETRTSNIVIIVVSLVVLVVLGVALLIICLLVPRVRHSKHTKQVSCNNNVKTQLEFCDSTSQESNHLPSHSTHMYDTTTSDATSTAPDDSTSQILSSSESDLESGFFNAEEVVQASSVCSPATKHSPSNDSQSQKKSHTVLLIYSPNTTEREQELIHILMAELQLYRIKVLSHDLTSIQGSTSAWLEREAKKASVVLCICNKEFKEDWEGQSEASLPLIQSLKHLIHGTAQNIDESLSKYAVVLLELSHRQYIPTMYLQSDSRQFTMPDTRAIAQYVKNIPSYELSRQSAMAAISDSV